MKLHKQICDINVVRSGEIVKIKSKKITGEYSIYLLGQTFGSMTVPSWELVSLWYQLGELLGFDREDAKLELERLHWKHDQGELDKPSQRIIGRKHRRRLN